MADEKLTPMLQQYFEVKRSLAPNTLLLFRLGDFYELFFEDAEIGAKLLGITLTGRNGHPMAGIPFHAADNYVGKILAAGRKVAICDQTEAPQAGRLVRRAVTRILSPGTTLETNQLDSARNRYLAALARDSRGLHAAWMDLSTGEFRLASDPTPENLLPVLHALAPSELVLPEGALAVWRAAPHHETALHALARFAEERVVSELPGYHFETSAGAHAVKTALGVLNLQGFGLADDHPGLGPAGALVHYATENLRAKPENLRTLREYSSRRSLLLDPATLRNLEIFTSVSGARAGSLLAALDRTLTPGGARLLERFLAAPPLDLVEIARRQSAVGELLDRPALLAELRGALKHVRDIPRILGRLQNRLRNPREVAAVRETLEQLPTLLAGLAQAGVPGLAALRSRMADLPVLRDRLHAALREELPTDLAEGGYIRPGFDAELDRLRSLTTDNKTWLAELERAEQERSGIRSLKVKFNNAFGYYIEVTKANLHLVPPDYIRRQTTVGGERFITEALRAKEKEIFHAEENALAREQSLFAGLVALVLDDSIALQQTADALAELDVFAGWAVLTRENDYVCPTVDDSDVLEIDEGRHPVIEQTLRHSPGGLAGTRTFVPNDSALSGGDAQIILLTGPNMAGKSTYIRQIALLVLMAHIGCWVPAKRCRLGWVDRIFSRVGASDDLARGNSTFMVEMN